MSDANESDSRLQDVTPNPDEDSKLGMVSSGLGTRRIKVLLVEDNPGDARFIRELLHELPGNRFDLEVAGRLGPAVERLDQGSIDLVLLDLSLPESSGIETFHRTHAAARGAPIVVLSGNEDETLAIEAVKAGAQDYLAKKEITSAVMMRSMRYAIERSRRQKLERAQRLSAQELNVARQIQQKLFPAEPPKLVNYDIAGASHPAEAMGGDYFDYIPMRHGHLGLVVGDVAGHGFGPALLMIDTRAYLRAFTQTYSDVGDILSLVDRGLFGDTAGDHFVTLILARLMPRTRTLVYTNAGHPSGYILDASGQVKHRLESTGVPLGVLEGCDFPTQGPIPLETGDLILFVTDGLIDASPTGKVIFGTHRILDVVRAHQHEPAAAIVAALHQSVRDFAQRATLDDDVTAMVVKVLPTRG